MDSTGIFKTRANENGPSANGDAQSATSTLQSVMNAGQKTQWLMLCRPQGVVEVSPRHVTITLSHMCSVRLDLDPPQIDFGVLYHCDRFTTEHPS
jgi:hypothetical protein